MKWKFFKATDIILGLSMFTLAIAVVLMVKCEKFDSAITLSAIMSSIIIPFCTKNLELEKHQKRFLYEKKYNAYSKYFEMCDQFWKISGQTVVNIHLFNTKQYNSKEKFEEQKNKVLELFKLYTQIRDFLSMPGVEMLIFINDEIERKIKEFIELDDNRTLVINSEDDLNKNMEKVKKYIKVISELTTLLKKDLGIEEK